MEEKVIKKMEESITNLLEGGLTTANVDTLYKLSKIKHLAKEDKEMNYGNYGNYEGYSGRGPGHGSYGRGYGEYGEYGRRGRDSKYRGEEAFGRMGEEYGRYQEYRGRYGQSEDTDKSFYYMIKALEDFLKVLQEEADTPQQKQQLKQALEKSMM